MADNPFEYFAREKRFQSIAEVVKTAAVYAGDRAYRIEVLKHHDNPNSPYSTLCWAEREIPIDGEPQSVWVKYDLPWTSGNTPDEALGEALHFLADENPKSTKAGA
jgi:hypothetical protein